MLSSFAASVVFPSVLAQIPAEIQIVSRRVAASGGRANLVGGAVVDLLQGGLPKDWDIEIFGMSFSQISEVFSDFHPDLVGRAFGVVKICPNGVDVDLCVPRKDNHVGAGHTDVECLLDPRMTTTEAARRRDFTINARAIDLATGELIDPFGGLADLAAGVLRATDPAFFVQDPLRGLRAVQLISRKAQIVDPGTFELIRQMSRACSALPKERLWGEFQKLLLKGSRPSRGLELFRATGWIDHFPELTALVGCGQHPEWCPEGDVWTHSCLAADAAASVRELIPEAQREAFVFGVWLHDIGKPVVTVTPEMVARGESPADRLWSAHGHDAAGIPLAERLLRRLTDSTRTIRLATELVGQHMQPHNLTSGGAGHGAFLRLHRKLAAVGGDLVLLGRVCQCDSCATAAPAFPRRIVQGTPDWEHRTSERMFEVAEVFHQTPTEPVVLGRDLLARGFRPGPEVGVLLKRAREIQESSEVPMTREEILCCLFPEG